VENRPIILDCKPENVLSVGDHGRLIISTEVMLAVSKYLVAYATAARERMHEAGKVDCENFREDLRYLLAMEETALDIDNNLKRALKRQGVTQ
jgi:hypothetical protein